MLPKFLSESFGFSGQDDALRQLVPNHVDAPVTMDEVQEALRCGDGTQIIVRDPNGVRSPLATGLAPIEAVELVRVLEEQLKASQPDPERRANVLLL